MKKTTPSRDKKPSAFGRSLGVAGLSVASLPFVVAPAMAESNHPLQPQDSAMHNAAAAHSGADHWAQFETSIAAAGLAVAASEDEAEEEEPDDGIDEGYGVYLHDAGVIGAEFDDEDDRNV